MMNQIGMTARGCWLLLCCWLLILFMPGLAVEAVRAQVSVETQFQAAVRETEPLTPSEEQKLFLLPDGFEVDLISSEPTIQKPLNMCFDAKGRLWVSSTIEYPIPADEGQGRDRIQVLEDTNGDGRYDKVTVFAENLNIPIGLYPYKDGVVCFSIPNIWFLRDVDGDGKCDEREVLYGPFDCSRDTHGMCNAFRRGFDGWLYACHGFNNQSRVAGKDGHLVALNSGNTFRIQLDGSRIEHFTQGQVNPFGLDWDPFGNLYSADCHTKPLSLLLQNGSYESFGKPHDGIGFVPNLMEHLHGSTAIAGVAIYNSKEFPATYHGNAFGGNVMTSRINRNRLLRQGGSIRAKAEADFLISSDPWFRPVDLCVGPDGALYVADFYNRIIGHYEVPLEHPGRDRARGRIWRIRYGKHNASRSQHFADKSLAMRIQELSHTSLNVRKAATDAIVDEIGGPAIPGLREVLRSEDGIALHHAAWGLLRLGDLQLEDWQLCMQSELAENRAHALRMLKIVGFREGKSAIMQSFGDASGEVRRAAVNAAGSRFDIDFLPHLLAFCADNSDPHLQHAAMLAVRNGLRTLNDIASQTSHLTANQVKLLLRICLAVPSEASADFMFFRLSQVNQLENPSQYYAVMSKHLSRGRADDLIDSARERFAGQIDSQETLIRSMFQANGLTPSLQTWADQLCCELLDCKSPAECRFPDSIGWSLLSDNSDTVWGVSSRRATSDGQQDVLLLSSFPAGESKTGSLRSSSFRLQSDFHFYLAGHDGFPHQKAKEQNFVQLCLAENGSVLETWKPPRNDVAQRVTLSASTHVGKQVYLELVDGDSESAYAWLAAGRFSTSSLSIERSLSLQKSLRLIHDLKLESFAPSLRARLETSGSNSVLNVEYARCLDSINPHRQGAFLLLALQEGALPFQVVAGALMSGEEVPMDLLKTVFQHATLDVQKRLAMRLVNSRHAASGFIEMLQRGWASSKLLTEEDLIVQLESLCPESMGGLLKQMINEESRQVSKTFPIDKWRELIKRGTADPRQGETVFSKNCSQCHQVASKGGQVGPNLDGIGNRGFGRVLEDVLLPNQNVDEAFRASLVVTEEGRVFSGLAWSLEEDSLSIIDSRGKEIRVEVADIVQRRRLRRSPMPDNFHETLSEQQVSDLMGYLMTLTK